MPRSPRFAPLALVLFASVAHATPAAGPVPGSPDLAMTVTADQTHCGGQRYQVKVVKTRTGKSDREFLSAMTVAYPLGLDIGSTNQPKAKAALRKFSRWFDDAISRMKAANARYEKLVFEKTTPEQAVAAMAHIALLNRHFANVIDTAEIPAALAAGDYANDTVNAFCDTLDEQAAPLDAKADEAAAACAKVATESGIGPGWWDAVCVAPVTSPLPKP